MSIEIKLASKFNKLLSAENIVSVVSESSQNAVDMGRGGGGFKRIGKDLEVFSRESRRGGVFGKVCKRWYFTFSRRYRTHQELDILEFLEKKGFPTSKPVASYVNTKGIVYSSFLLTKKIEHSKNLLASLRNKEISAEYLVNICENIGELAKKLLFHGVVHKDLHLGNILYRDDSVFIIDFDKAHFLAHPSKYLSSKDELIARFSRSCMKHGVSDVCIRAFIDGVS